MRQRYLIALGSNVRHHRHGRPERVLAAALAALAPRGIAVLAAAPVLRSAAVGPSLRRYANSAALIETPLDPQPLLAELQSIERAFGRRPGGQRWTSRVLDLDIVLWSGGAWSTPGLNVPHPLFRERHFVLEPAAVVVPDWRDPVSNLTVRHLGARLRRSAPLRA
ncbi:MAG: 2-amino-4-hydroxy-6-hydroxymethyldihydropteridine diphosphokinase [Novosphingobium sp.]|uniref:2-amino-4-hydroxy-6- hydroxymethyldihydropteridine diphosphokinase n=1 Tax=Novosphingobium sp. TaxID=1874826 RepID=UPI0032BE8CE3